MSKVYTGTVKGERAQNYPGHVYRTAVIRPFTIDDVDPDRVYADREYPRWSSKPTDRVAHKTEPHVDWKVVITDNPETFAQTVAVYICATPYTSATDDAGVLQYEINAPGMMSDQLIVEQALRFAFD